MTFDFRRDQTFLLIYKSLSANDAATFKGVWQMENDTITTKITSSDVDDSELNKIPYVMTFEGEDLILEKVGIRLVSQKK